MLMSLGSCTCIIFVILYAQFLWHRPKCLWNFTFLKLMCNLNRELKYLKIENYKDFNINWIMRGIFPLLKCWETPIFMKCSPREGLFKFILFTMNIVMKPKHCINRNPILDYLSTKFRCYVYPAVLCINRRFSGSVDGILVLEDTKQTKKQTSWL
jgi:hypothetical protein